MSVFDRIRRFDAFAKTQDDFRTQTFVGGIVTLVCAGLVLFLSSLAFADYRLVRWKSEVLIDRSQDEKIPVNFDLTFPRLPCFALTLDVMDGETHQNNIIDNIIKTRLDSHGIKIIQYEEPHAISDPNYCGSCYAGNDSDGEREKNALNPHHRKACCNSCSSVFAAYSARKQPPPKIDDVEQCVKEGWAEKLKTQASEGCHVTGSFSVDKTSGDFHFAPGQSYDANRIHIHDIRLFENLQFDFSHTIHALHFGPRHDKLSEPLKGVEFIAKDSTPPFHLTCFIGRLVYSYFLKIVPTEFRLLDGKVAKTYQYSATRHKKVLSPDDNNFPSLVVRYDISPMLVANSEYRKSFTSFLTSLTAILGGMYTLAAIFDAVFFFAERKLLQKSAMGKIN